MSLNSPCRISYSRWRLQVFQQLFGVDACPAALPARFVQTRTAAGASQSRSYYNASARSQRAVERVSLIDDHCGFESGARTSPEHSNPQATTESRDVQTAAKLSKGRARSMNNPASVQREISYRSLNLKDGSGMRVRTCGSSESHTLRQDYQDNAPKTFTRSSTVKTSEPVRFAPLDQSPQDVDGLIAALDTMIVQQEVEINRISKALARGKIVRRIISADEPEEYLDFRVRWVTSATVPKASTYNPELDLPSPGGAVRGSNMQRAPGQLAVTNVDERESQKHEIEENSLNVRSKGAQSAEASSRRERARTGETNARAPDKSHSSTIAISPLERHIDRVRNRPVKPHPAGIQAEQKFRHNPWALMLAGSNRLCTASKIRTPYPLLDDFTFAAHPGEDGTYILPQRLADLTRFKAELTNNRLPDFKPPRETRGKVVRMLPDQVLQSQLLRKLTTYNSNKNTREAKLNAVAGRLLPAFWLDENNKRRTYEHASKGYWTALEAQGGSVDDHQQRQQSMDYSRLKWAGDIDERLLLIMRQRVLMALDAVGEMESRPDRKPQKTTLRLPEHEEGWRVEAEGSGLVVLPEEKEHQTSQEAIKMEFWNDMGDIEAEHAITGTGHRQGHRTDGRPPIALRPDEIETHEFSRADSKRTVLKSDSHECERKQDGLTVSASSASMEQAEHTPRLIHERYFDGPSRWLPGSIILDLDDPTISTKRDLYESASRTGANDATTIDHYLPPTITITIKNKPHLIPIFPVQALLQRPDLIALLDRIHLKHDALKPNFEPPRERSNESNVTNMSKDSDGDNKMILFKATGQKTHTLAAELWRLWRYTGGTRCLCTPQLGKGLSNAQHRELLGFLGLSGEEQNEEGEIERNAE